MVENNQFRESFLGRWRSLTKWSSKFTQDFHKYLECTLQITTHFVSRKNVTELHSASNKYPRFDVNICSICFCRQNLIFYNRLTIKTKYLMLKAQELFSWNIRLFNYCFTIPSKTTSFDNLTDKIMWRIPMTLQQTIN